LGEVVGDGLEFFEGELEVFDASHTAFPEINHISLLSRPSFAEELRIVSPELLGRCQRTRLDPETILTQFVVSIVS